MTMKLALTVPGLDHYGGVPAVASFIKDTALRAVSIDVMMVSLSMDSADPCSLNLHRPHTWARGVTCADGIWEDMPFTHVGAMFGDFEFQRYRPSAALSRVLADCDLIQVVCGSPAWANSVLGLGKPVSLQVATRARVERCERDLRGTGPIAWWRRAMTTVTDRLDDRALRHVDAIQVENPWMLDYARKVNAGRKIDIRYAPPGIDAQLFRPAAVRNPPQDPYILCVGRLDDPRKRVGLLLDAFVLLPQSIRDSVCLVLAGAAGPPAAFWSRADALHVRERIRFVERPDSSELIRLYQGASLFALPSDEEGFGIVVIEAMACGIPVVATRCGGPDGIIMDGEDGFLVPRDDAATMAERLTRLLQQPVLNREMGVKARASVERRFDARVAGAAFVDVWDRLLHKAGAR